MALMCVGPEIAAVAAAIPELAAVPEAAAAAAAPEMMGGLLNAAPGVLAPGQAAMGSLESAMINNGMGQGASMMNGILGGAGKAASGMSMANAGMGLMQPQQPQQMPGPRMQQQQPEQSQAFMPYGDPEEEKKRKLLAMMRGGY